MSALKSFEYELAFYCKNYVMNNTYDLFAVPLIIKHRKMSWGGRSMGREIAKWT